MDLVETLTWSISTLSTSTISSFSSLPSSTWCTTWLKKFVKTRLSWTTWFLLLCKPTCVWKFGIQSSSFCLDNKSEMNSGRVNMDRQNKTIFFWRLLDVRQAKPRKKSILRRQHGCQLCWIAKQDNKWGIQLQRWWDNMGCPVQTKHCANQTQCGVSPVPQRDEWQQVLNTSLLWFDNGGFLANSEKKATGFNWLAMSPSRIAINNWLTTWRTKVTSRRRRTTCGFGIEHVIVLCHYQNGSASPSGWTTRWPLNNHPTVLVSCEMPTTMVEVNTSAVCNRSKATSLCSWTSTVGSTRILAQQK